MKHMGRVVSVGLVFAVACVATQQAETGEVESATGSGSGSGSCATPALSVVLAPTPLATELRTTNRITVIVQTASFASTPTVTLSAFDASTNAAVTDWTISPAQTLAMPSTGTAVLAFDVTIPSDALTLAARVRARATYAGAAAETWGTITAAKQLTLEFASGTGAGAPHAGLPQSLQVRAGTKVRFHNADEIQHVIHGDSVGGLYHEMVDAGPPGGLYEVTITGDSHWYCHTHEAGTANRTITVVY
jgi:plastocyanin